MVRVRVASINVDMVTEQPVIMLRSLDDPDDRRLVPIWIGQYEATAILLAMRGERPPRPMTHDLFHDALVACGWDIVAVEITRLDGGTFFASLRLLGPGGELSLDSRPSDAVAMAARAGCPIFLEDAVLDEAGVVFEGAVDEEEEVEQFREFLDHVDPADFLS